MNHLRIGVIGVGWFGEIHAETIAGVPNLELAALCTRTPDRLAAMGEKFGVKKLHRDYKDMLADPDIDAVSICTMWDQHTEPAIAALKAGKHVFLEKPIASTVEDGRAITAASKGAKGILFIGHVVRFNPRYRMAKQAIDEGRIGKIVALSSRRNIPAAWTPTILNKIGPIVGDAIHDTDIMLWFTGDHVISAYAQTVDVRGLRFPDIGQTMYRFAGGATATLETVWCMPEKTPFDIDERMSVIGTDGIIHIQDTFPNLAVVDSNKLHSPDSTYWPMFNGVRGGALRDEFNYFASCALQGKSVTIGTPEDATAALEATLAAEEFRPHGQYREDWLMLEYVFDHVGITTTEPQSQEDWVEVSKIWVTNPRNHPEHIEFLRYRHDSTVPAAVRDNPHVAYRVKELEPYLEGCEILIPPFIVGDFLEVVFVRRHGMIFEYMRYLKDGWFGN